MLFQRKLTVSKVSGGVLHHFAQSSFFGGMPKSCRNASRTYSNQVTTDSSPVIVALSTLFAALECTGAPLGGSTCVRWTMTTILRL